MPKPSVLIVDDEPLALSRLRALCERLSLFDAVNTANGGLAALEMIDQVEPDIVLLDVDMPDLSGLQVAGRCQANNRAVEIIFTTAHSRYAVQAFRLEATDYLLKPVKEVMLREAIDRAMAKLDLSDKATDAPESEQRIWVRDGAGSIQLHVEDIERIEAERDYMRLFLNGRSYLVHESMRSLESRLPGDLFIRVHRSSIVRRDIIREIRREGRKKFLRLADDTDIQIGPSYADRISALVLDQAGGLGTSDTVRE